MRYVELMSFDLKHTIINTASRVNCVIARQFIYMCRWANRMSKRAIAAAERYRALDDQLIDQLDEYLKNS